MKYRLKVASGALTGQTFDLNEEQTSIGGSLSMDIKIEDLEGHHATIKAQMDGLTLIPESDSIVYLNGDALQGPCGLNSGDEIRLGTHHFVLQAPGLRPQRILHQTTTKPKRKWGWIIVAGLIMLSATVWWLGSTHPEVFEPLGGWPWAEETNSAGQP